MSGSSSLAPLRHPAFAVLWAATILGNTGTFMRDVASAWLAAEISGSPVAVGMIQAAGALPVFLLAIPAGVLSDIVDRRKLLIVMQVLLGCISGLLMLLAFAGALSITALVALTFAGGVCFALVGPSWQAIVPELVPREDLKSAVALNSLGFNIARSIGPALGGLVLAGFGAAATYGGDVLSYVFVIAALLWWRRNADATAVLPEQFGGAFRAGLRYAKASRELHVVLLRAALFFLFTSAVWALLPLVSLRQLGGSAAFYGVLLGAVGAGAILGALALPRLRAHMDGDRILLAAALAAALVMGILAFTTSQIVAAAVLLLLGAAWITALTTLNGTAQAILPNWVRGRGLAIYLTVFNGAMAAGSLAWGAVAEAIGIPLALAVAAAGTAVIALAALRLKLPAGEADLTPSNHWPEPIIAAAPDGKRGPVLVLVEYEVESDRRGGFLEDLHKLGATRRRDGAYAWGVSEDTADPRRLVEWFMVESWHEHLRQHHRVSKADAELQQRLRACLLGEPTVRHLIGLD